MMMSKPESKGFEGPYQLTITKGLKLAVIDKHGKIAWSQDPDYCD